MRIPPDMGLRGSGGFPIVVPPAVSVVWSTEQPAQPLLLGGGFAGPTCIPL